MEDFSHKTGQRLRSLPDSLQYAQSFPVVFSWAEQGACTLLGKKHFKARQPYVSPVDTYLQQRTSRALTGVRHSPAHVRFHSQSGRSASLEVSVTCLADVIACARSQCCGPLTLYVYIQQSPRLCKDHAETCRCRNRQIYRS